jgi:hypothetical protein
MPLQIKSYFFVKNCKFGHVFVQAIHNETFWFLEWFWEILTNLVGICQNLLNLLSSWQHFDNIWSVFEPTIINKEQQAAFWKVIDEGMHWTYLHAWNGISPNSLHLCPRPAGNASVTMTLQYKCERRGRCWLEDNTLNQVTQVWYCINYIFLICIALSIYIDMIT